MLTSKPACNLAVSRSLCKERTEAGRRRERWQAPRYARTLTDRPFSRDRLCVDTNLESPGIVEPAATGVIYVREDLDFRETPCALGGKANVLASLSPKVMNRASANGFSYDDPEWANFGQGEHALDV